MDRARQLDELDQAATTDQLTGIGNRRAYEQRLAQLAEDAAVILYDLDRFKQLNDTQGHPAGDRVLRAFAALAASCVRAQTDLVARIGGDEFALIVDRGETTARNVLERLRSGWNNPENVGFSAGIAARAIGEDAYQLAERADQALYAEKRRHHRKRQF